MRKMVTKKWIRHGANNSPDELVGVAMTRIETEPRKFDEFIKFLAAIEGLQHLAKRIKGIAIRVVRGGSTEGEKVILFGSCAP